VVLYVQVSPAPTGNGSVLAAVTDVAAEELELPELAGLADDEDVAGDEDVPPDPNEPAEPPQPTRTRPAAIASTAAAPPWRPVA
jgi:hypothetical protein